METTRRGNKQTKQAAHVPMTKVNKQKNKQTNTRQHMWGADAGVIQCCTICGVCYTTCQSTQRGFRDVWRSVESDAQGHTLTRVYEQYPLVWELDPSGSDVSLRLVQQWT